MDRSNELNTPLFKTGPEKPIDVHKEIWEKRANSALSNPFDRYAFYTSRSLFVAHPEVYLRADRHFYKYITTVPGYKNAFLEDDRESKEFLPHAQYFRSAPFSFDLFPWEKTKTVTDYRAIYPEHHPSFPFADQRMLPIATTLKTTKKIVTELEMASMRFQMAVDAAGSSDNIFIIFSEKALAWVADGDQISCAVTGKPVDKPSGKIVLVFNDRFVYYPLMGRDDSDKSPGLKKIITTLKGLAGMPDLSEQESQLLPKVKKGTELDNDIQADMATIAAVRSTGRYTHWYDFHTLWDKALPANKERAWQYYGFMEQFMIRANSLSPIAAYIAACSRNAKGYDKILCVDREWIDLAALPNHNYVWGHLWDECLVEYTIDESFRSNAAHCMAQACIVSAILEMAGIEHYLLEGEIPGSHHYVFVPEYEFTFDNGKLQSSQKTIHWNGPRGNKVLARFHYKGKFASPFAGGHYSGTFSPSEAVDVIERLKSFYNDKIPIYKDGDHEMNKRRVPMEKRPTTTDFNILLDEEWEELILP